MKFSTTLAALFLPLVVYSEIECPGVPSDADCETCLGAGCVTAAGECMSDCSFIADAACYSVPDDSTVEEVCARKASDEADAALCATPNDCETCTSTLKSDGESTCQWYSPVGGVAYCSTGGCDMMGACGSDTCDLGADGPCGGFPACEPCLNSRLECAWIAGRCQPDCRTNMDVTCYDTTNFRNMTGPEICAIAAANGEETPEDMENSHPCNAFEICEPCLNSRIDCAWIGNRCEPSCDGMMNLTCYHPANFPNMTGPEMCAIATANEEETPEDMDNSHPCNAFEICEPCLNSRIDCAWIANRCEPSCEGMMDLTCYHPANFPNMIGPEICAIAAANEEEIQEDLDNSHPCNAFEICEPCLNSRIDCAWIANRCEASCDVIMDVACYHPANFPNMTGPEICAIANTEDPVIMGPPDVLMNDTLTDETVDGEVAGGAIEETSDDTDEGEVAVGKGGAPNGEIGSLESTTSGTMNRFVHMAGIVVVSAVAIAFF